MNGDGTSTVYIGGAFEKNFNAQGAATATTKYYSGMGRPFAYRTAGSGGGTGTLQWILADHLGSTTGLVNASASLISSQKYWPYGAVRTTSGTVATDKLFTGQRQEATPPDSALGLTNYKARFYSTTLGRFASADLLLKDGLNRYSYVRDNPLALADPTGLDATIVCGTGNRCQEGAIDNYKRWILAYWKLHEHIFGGMCFDGRISCADWAFMVLKKDLAAGADWAGTLGAFHVAFLNTTDNLQTDIRLAAAERFPGYDDGLEHWENVFWKSIAHAGPRLIDTLIGYSAGGSTVERILEQAHNNNYHFEAAIIIQPGAQINAGGTHRGFYTHIHASDVPGTRIVTVNDTESGVRGTVSGAFNVETTNACAGNSFDHCSEEQVADYVVWASMQQPGITGDQTIAYGLPAGLGLTYGD